MGVIVPAIVPTSREDLEEKLGRLVGLVTEVQIDIDDGRFAGPATWPYANGTVAFAEHAQLPHAEEFRFEMDLMVRDPEQVTGTWIQAGASRIVAHLESTTYLPRLITDLKTQYGHAKGFAPDLLSFGIALNDTADISLLEPYIADVDFVQFMGIRRIGVQGQPFDTAVLRQIAAFRRKHPDIPIQVDGGVSLASAPQLLDAGVSRLIVGSALWKAPNLKEAYEKLVALTQTHGLYQ